MPQFFELLQYPFVQRAIVSGISAAAMLATLGIFVSLRKMSFFGDGLAHASLAGVAIGLLLGQEPIIWAVIFSVFFAIAIYFLEQKSDIAPDSLIGILFTSSLALGVLLINLKSGYQPDLLSFLFGNILTIRTVEMLIIAILTVLIVIFLFSRYKQYLFLSLNEEMAKLSGIQTARYRLALYIMLAVATVLSVKVLGVILVSALLIIPVSTAKLISASSKSLLILSLFFSEITILLGLILSLFLNLPASSVIVLTNTVLFLGVLLLRRI